MNKQQNLDLPKKRINEPKQHSLQCLNYSALVPLESPKKPSKRVHEFHPNNKITRPNGQCSGDDGRRVAAVKVEQDQIRIRRTWCERGTSDCR